MILPMKKYSFLVYHGDYTEFLKKLGKLGVLHVIEREDVDKEASLKDERRYLEHVENALELLTAEKREEDAETTEIPGRELVDRWIGEIMHVNGKINDLREKVEAVNREIERQLPWGDYEREDLEKIQPAGYTVRLYQCSSSQFDPDWQDRHDFFLISDHGGKKYFMILQKDGEETDIDAEIIEPGRKSLSRLNEEIQEIEIELTKAEVEMMHLRGRTFNALKNFRRQLNDEIAFKSVYLESKKASDGKIRILEGWVPEEAEEKLNEFLEDEAVVSLAEQPPEGEMPPVQLKNSRFSRLFEPISKLFDLPAYNELDLTPFFAPFFMIFFGFCLGDAGYGVFFILLAGLLKLRVKKDFKPMLTLAQYFGVATIIFGLLSGTFFGINLIDSGYTVTENSLQRLESSDVPAQIVMALQEIEGVYFEGRNEFLDAVGQQIGAEPADLYQTELLKHAESGIPFIGYFRHLMQDPLSMFYLSLLIGGIQIVFGLFVRVLNITRRSGFRHALSTIGWLALIISLILYFSGLLKGNGLEYLFYGLMAVSGVLIFLLNRPGINILARVGSGIWDSYGMVTGIFGDLLSYIRLFALGISSAILGFVFNDISLQLLNIPYIGWLFFLIILLAGHSINIFLATLGGFVHPMRLTFVEFYKNAGFAGGGKKYKPFVITH